MLRVDPQLRLWSAEEIRFLAEQWRLTTPLPPPAEPPALTTGTRYINACAVRWALRGAAVLVLFLLAFTYGWVSA